MMFAFINLPIKVISLVRVNTGKCDLYKWCMILDSNSVNNNTLNLSGVSYYETINTSIKKKRKKFILKFFIIFKKLKKFVL